MALRPTSQSSGGKYEGNYIFNYTPRFYEPNRGMSRISTIIVRGSTIPPVRLGEGQDTSVTVHRGQGRSEKVSYRTSLYPYESRDRLLDTE